MEKNLIIFIKVSFYIIKILSILFLISSLLLIQVFLVKNKQILNLNKQINKLKEKCYSLSDNTNIQIVHLIITRFLSEKFFGQKIYKDNFIINGIRVMNKYLLPSLENQSCKSFIWVLMVGKLINITYIEELLKFNCSFRYKIIYENEIEIFIKNITKSSDVLITTRIDYDDIIYYDAVNDIRKAININKPMLLFGYNRGAYYFESNGKYYDYYNTDNNGTLAIFTSLICSLKKINGTYNIFNIGAHTHIRKNLLKNFKSYGIEKISYEPAIFDSGDPKFVWVRQKFSGLYNDSINRRSYLIEKPFSLSKFSGN